MSETSQNDGPEVLIPVVLSPVVLSPVVLINVFTVDPANQHSIAASTAQK